MKLRSFIIVLLLSVALTLSACNLPVPSAPNQNALSTAAARTVEAALASAATATSTQASLTTSTPTAAKCEEGSVLSSWTRDGVPFDAKEVEKHVAPNKGFVMSWMVKNTGTCIWDDKYKMVFESGTHLTTNDTLPVMPFGYHVKNGEVLTINVQMIAPAAAGTYDSTYSVINAEGKDVLTFGVTTNVGSASSASLAAPGDLRYTYDCTSGNVSIGLFWVDKSSDEDGFRIYRDGAKLADVAAGSTSYQDIAPTVGKFKYTVAAFNSSGESPASVNVQTSNCQ